MRYRYVYLLLIGAFLVTHCSTKSPEINMDDGQPTNTAGVVEPIITATNINTVGVGPSADKEFNKRQGDKIIVAIEVYYEVNGVFPEKLELLIPAYLQEIPTTKDGRDFEYNLNDYFGYFLLFYIPGTEDHKNCAYSHNEPEWECSFYIPQ